MAKLDASDEGSGNGGNATPERERGRFTPHSASPSPMHRSIEQPLPKAYTFKHSFFKEAAYKMVRARLAVLARSRRGGCGR